jgi:hypothetical protein
MVAVAPVPSGVRLPEKEILSFGVEWRLVRAGSAVMNWSAAPRAGARHWQANLRLESTGLVSKLFKVDDRYESLLNAEFCTLSSFLNAQEGSRQRETKVTFDGAAGKASYLEKDLVKNSVVLSKEIEIPGCVHDVVSGLYYLRTIRLEPGQATQIPVSDGKKLVMARVEAQAREPLTTPAGSFKTVRYEAFLFNNVLFRRSGRLYVWLTDDNRRLPVQIRARLQFHIGTITLQLEKEQRS